MSTGQIVKKHEEFFILFGLLKDRGVSPDVAAQAARELADQTSRQVAGCIGFQAYHEPDYGEGSYA